MIPFNELKDKFSQLKDKYHERAIEWLTENVRDYLTTKGIFVGPTFKIICRNVEITSDSGEKEYTQVFFVCSDDWCCSAQDLKTVRDYLEKFIEGSILVINLEACGEYIQEPFFFK